MILRRLASPRILASLTVVPALLLAAPVFAVVVLDTYGPGVNSPPLGAGTWSLYNIRDEFGQSLAVPFTLAAPSTINDIRTSISGDGSFNLGVTSGPGLPTVVLSHGIVLTDPVANVLHTGLNWTLAAGDYWLVATGVRPSDGQWQGAFVDGIRPWAFTIPDWNATWTAPFADNAPAARIHATVVPEPATWALWLGGVGLLTWSARRRGRPAGRQTA